MESRDLPIHVANLRFVEDQWTRFLADPSAVDESWRRFFEGLDGDDRAARALGGSPFERFTLFRPPARGAAAVQVASRSPASGGRDLPSIPKGELGRRVGQLAEQRIFAGAPAAELTRVARLAKSRSLRDGEVLFRSGEPGHELFVLVAGHLVVQRGHHVVATINPGEVVGELSVLDAQPRSADVLAHGEASVLSIAGDDLEALISHRPALGRSIIHMLSSRLRLRSDRQNRVNQLIHAYRVRGHLRARLDPLGGDRPPAPELDPGYYGLGEHDLDSLFAFGFGTSGTSSLLTLREILALLEAVYCRSIGVQFMHIDDIDAKDWLIEHLENAQHHRHLDRAEKLRIFTKLTDAEILEQFIHRKFLGAKRFSLEGAETMIPLLDLALEEAGAQKIDEVVIGMAHRGRLNVLVNIMGKSPRQIFREFSDDSPERHQGAGDVKYHLGFGGNRKTDTGHSLHLALCFNPSHLEFVDPVVVGRVRAKQDRFGDTPRRRCMGVLIHGDAAFAGQGVVQELFNMSKLPGYDTGGTLHLIVNNQIGFTTPPEHGRSTQYASDVARMLQTPVFHVNGEDPDAVAQVVRLAMAYRERFQEDVVIDMYCYRRFGHNEGDEPTYTQPLMYRGIRRRKSVRDGYLASLADEGIGKDDAARIEAERRDQLEKELTEAREAKKPPTEEARVGDATTGTKIWRPYRGGPDAEVEDVSTSVAAERLSALLEKLTETPKSFNLHKKLERGFAQRRQMAAGDKPLDWAAAEALAFATLVTEGSPVRISGQDAPRGTFSHRHAELHDFENGATFVPLANLAENQARFEVYNSPLSEVGVVGFEYGYSLDMPEGLIVWEAQFGDFSNVAQVIMDQFISSGEDKWNRLSGLVMLLPHGFEGQGPEHSSARLERFLSLAAEDNIQVVNLTTPAQLFHCLRRQVIRPWRKPLVVMSPKSLLRHSQVSSKLDDLATGSFQRIIGDVIGLQGDTVRKVILTSGKVYYELADARAKRESNDVAILRLEQYYPLSQDVLRRLLEAYPPSTPLVWVQEEPSNMGAWSFLHRALDRDITDRWPLSCVCRRESASPATGSAAMHRIEQAELIDRALA